MKKNKGKTGALGVLLILLVVALAVTGLGNWYFFRVARDIEGYDLHAQIDYIVDDEIKGRVNAGGVPALEQMDLRQYGEHWADPERANAVMVDAQGNVLAQTGSLVTAGDDKLNLALAAYPRYFDDWVYRSDDITIFSMTRGRLGVVLGEQGQVFTSFMATDDTAVKTVGQVSSQQYSQLFPHIGQDLYNMMVEDEQGHEASPAAFERAEQYVAWENQSIQEAGALRATIVPLTGAQAGRTVVLFYLSDEVSHAQEIGVRRMYNRANALGAAVLALLLLFWLLLPIWVFRDAKRRGFKPALWGVLTLLANVIAWIVYMIVRPSNGASSACPQCGEAVTSAYAFCPACGHVLKNRCPGCHKAVSENWHVCPYCGMALGEDAGAKI